VKGGCMMQVQVAIVYTAIAEYASILSCDTHHS
jgi:hypothetical protein